MKIGGILKYIVNQLKNTENKKIKYKIVWKIGIILLLEMIAIIYTNIRRKVFLENNEIIDKNKINWNKENKINNPKEIIVKEQVTKNILITGSNSYIGMAIEKWLKKSGGNYNIETLDMKGNSWRNCDFSQYDVICHVAGIAHVDTSVVTEEQKNLYYKINTQLAVETAQKAKNAKVKQFIFMSSIIIYSGCREKMIMADTEPQPLDFYGDSKWQAEKKIRALEDDSFKVVVIRTPMVYGKGSKGNYPKLVKLAIKLPVFPIVKNKRSMIHIDNLCQFIKLMIDNEEKGVFFPQNGEYTNTSDMVQMIAKIKGHRIIMIPGGGVIKLMEKIPCKVGKLAIKAFGNSVYDMSMSEYKIDYRVNSFEKSIKLTEGDYSSGKI